MPDATDRLDRSARGGRAPRAAIMLAAVACFALPQAPGGPAARGAGQDLKKLNQFVQTSDSPPMRILREGRDLIDSQNWAQAAVKFSGFIAAYPADKDMDVALYWLSYSFRKMGRPRDAAKTLKQLVKFYPRSNWADEARALMLEVAGELGDKKIIEEAVNDRDEEDEIKIVALQSLFESSPERAMRYVVDILRPGSAASAGLREAAVSLLGSHGGREAVPHLLEIARTQPDKRLRVVAIRRLSDAGGEAAVDALVQLYDSEREPEVRAQILRTLSDTPQYPRARAKLVEVARNTGENSELRQSAIRRLGDTPDAPLDVLLQIYESDQNREIKEQILRALADMSDPRARGKLVEIARNTGGDSELRRQAIRSLADRPTDAVLDELMKIYDADRDLEVRKQILRALADVESPRAHQRLLDAARSGTNVELRQQAIRSLADDSDDAQTIEMLVSMYDAEQSVEIKTQLLRAYAESKQKSALRKLMDVARRDPSVELRKRAVQMIGESDDPEALKFLEDLLKP